MLVDTTLTAPPPGALLAAWGEDGGVALRVGTRCARGLAASLAGCHALSAVIARSTEPDEIAAALRARIASELPELPPHVRVAHDGSTQGVGDERDLLVLRAVPRALGPAAARLFSSAACNVLVARRPYAGGPIVVGHDLSDGAVEAVSAARALARRCGAPVVVVHSIDDAAPVEVPRPFGERLGAAARALARVVGPDVEIHVTTGPSDVSLLRAERELGARLLVVGATAAAQNRGPGEVASAVAAGATGSVLVARRVGAAE
jgi:nucleotide-binding universal stress UspA family protein